MGNGDILLDKREIEIITENVYNKHVARKLKECGELPKKVILYKNLNEKIKSHFRFVVKETVNELNHLKNMRGYW